MLLIWQLHHCFRIIIVLDYVAWLVLFAYQYEYTLCAKFVLFSSNTILHDCIDTPMIRLLAAFRALMITWAMVHVCALVFLTLDHGPAKASDMINQTESKILLRIEDWFLFPAEIAQARSDLREHGDNGAKLALVLGPTLQAVHASQNAAVFWVGQAQVDRQDQGKQTLSGMAKDAAVAWARLQAKLVDLAESSSMIDYEGDYEG